MIDFSVRCPNCRESFQYRCETEASGSGSEHAARCQHCKVEEYLKSLSNLEAQKTQALANNDTKTAKLIQIIIDRVKEKAPKRPTQGQNPVNKQRTHVQVERVNDLIFQLLIFYLPQKKQPHNSYNVN